MDISSIPISNTKQALVSFVDNEWPTALFRRNIQVKLMITTSLVNFNERATVSFHDLLGAPNENIVQKHLNMALLNAF